MGSVSFMLTSMSTDDERRKHRRISTRMKVTLGPKGDEQTAETTDISESGAGLLSNIQLKHGDKVEVEVLLAPSAAADPQKSITTMATVMWSAESDSGGYTSGLKFDGPSPEAMQRLRRFLDSQGDSE